MASGGVRVDRLREVLRALEQFGLDIDDLKDAFAKIASEGADNVRRHVPRKSGTLAASVRGNRAKSKAVVRAGRASVPYAGPINYGWRSRGIEPALFMQAGDQDTKPTAVRRLEDEIEQAITRRGLR